MLRASVFYHVVGNRGMELGMGNYYHFNPFIFVFTFSTTVSSLIPLQSFIIKRTYLFIFFGISCQSQITNDIQKLNINHQNYLTNYSAKYIINLDVDYVLRLPSYRNNTSI